MKVIIDISPLKSEHKTRGIGMYTRRLVDSIKKVDKKNQYIITTKSEQISGADVIHYPYFDLFFHTLPIKRKLKTVVTIHDVIPLIFPEDFPAGIKGKLRFILQRIALRSVDEIITDSDSSKRDIIKFLGVSEEKISRVYLAAAEEFRPLNQKDIDRVVQKYKLPKKYIFYVGDVNANKNLKRLIESFAIVNKKSPNLHLILVGRAFGDLKLLQVKQIKSLIEEKELEHKISIISNVPLDPPDDLVGIFNAATLYIQPSLYEGFGLPILEAYACGTPVVASNVSSIPEITAKSTILVDSNSPEEIAKGIEKTLKLSIKKRKELIEEGYLQVKKFSWEQTALETIKVYRQVLDRK